MLFNRKSRLNKRHGSRIAIGSAATPLRIFGARCMRIIAVSPFTRATKKEIEDFIATRPRALIVLPGSWTNTPSPRKIQCAIRGGSVVFAEGEKGKKGRSGLIIAKSKINRMPPQVFSKKPTESLAAVLPYRTIWLGRRTVTFFICGELIAFNPDGSVKHHRKLDHDTVINPAHTLMGHWNHLGKKLERLSRNSITVYVTNNIKNRHLTSDVRIYKDGELMKRHRGKNVAWSVCRI